MGNIFNKYQNGGRQLLGKHQLSNGKSRISSVNIVKECGTQCVYCDRDLSKDYESWLNISIDHVIPLRTEWATRHSDWIDDITNLVIACRACNEFLNKFKVSEVEPRILEDFYKIRDRALEEKKKSCKGRHEQEKKEYDAWKEKINLNNIRTF